MEQNGVLVFIFFVFVFLCVRADDDIREPPRITKPVTPRPVFFPLNTPENIVLNCTAEGRPPPSYNWYFNSLPIEPHLGDIVINHTRGSLTIKNPSPSVEGFYSCRARTTYPNGISAVSVSPNIEVRAARLESWPNNNPGVSKTATEGNYVFFKCDENRPLSVGPTNFKWYTIVGLENKEILPDERVFIDATGTLHFAYVKPEDTNPSYKCGLSNTIAGNIITGQANQLTVTPVSPVPETRPILQFSSETLTFETNTVAHLECFFSGHVHDPNKKVPTILWKDNANNEITDGQDRYAIKNSGRVLQISGLREADEKLYTCAGTSVLGTAEKAMMLNVTSTPIWVKPLESTTVPQGQDAVFHCEARSAAGEVPPDPPRWMRNGILMTHGYDPNKHQFSEGNRVLTVKSPRKDSDIACYQCYVGNSVGDTFGEACLNVILPIKIITRPAAQQTIVKGDIVNLTVVATSDPLYPVSYKWHFNNITYEGVDAPPHVTYDVNTQLAYINTSGLTDQQMRDIRGVYRREVFHKFEHFNVDVEVLLKGGPLGPVAAAGTFDYWIIGLILALLIILIILLIFCCVICRRKMQEGHYPVDKKENDAGLNPEKELEDSGFDELSRADLDPPEKSKALSVLDYNDMIGEGERDDDSFGSAEYGEEPTAFNEDGSFIGVYNNPGRKQSVPKVAHPAGESVV